MIKLCNHLRYFEIVRALVSVSSKEHNECVRTRARAWIGSLALLAASSVAATAFADLLSALTAMACCAKTNYQCAGLSRPDDCCQRMGHAAGPTVGTLSSASPLVVPAAVIIPGFIVAPASLFGPPSTGPAFKRPHDPPHLHPFSLLI